MLSVAMLFIFDFSFLIFNFFNIRDAKNISARHRNAKLTNS